MSSWRKPGPVRCGLFVLLGERCHLSCPRAFEVMGLGLRHDLVCARATSKRVLMPSARSLTRSAPTPVQATFITSSLLTVETAGRGFTDLTGEVAKFIAEAGVLDGALTLFIRHTSASLTIQ